MNGNHNKVMVIIFSVLEMSLSGCYFSHKVSLMNADHYEIDPEKVIATSDGGIAIEADLIRTRDKVTAHIPSYAYASADVVARNIQQSNKKGLIGVLNKPKVYRLKVEVDQPKRKGWRLLTDSFDRSMVEGSTYQMGETFDHPIGNKVYSIQIDSLRLAPDVARVKKGKTTLTQKALFLPALVLDIITAPLYLIYDMIYQSL